MKFIEGQDRHQLMIPDSLDQHISSNNPIRFIDAFVGNLDIETLGFITERKTSKGRAAYHPSAMLKLYIYGYLNKIRSSRDLERETYRNVELYWLINHLHPDHSSIARFRKNNWKAIRNLCREFTLVCKKLDMFDKELIAIDGSFFKASASKEKIVDRKTLKKKLKAIDKQIEKYLQSMNSTDKAERGSDLSEASLNEKITALQDQKNLYQAFEEQLETPDQKKSPADPDARLLKKGGKATLGYNIQTAVDPKHHLIVEHEVTTSGNDSNELAKMSIKAKETLEAEELKAVADTGYQNSQEVKRCLENGITPFVPERIQKKGDFSRDKFSYCSEKDCYYCPEGAELHFYSQGRYKGRLMRRYKTPACGACRRRSECTSNKNGRIISRWVHEQILEEMRQRIKAHPDILKKRKSMVEHPFGTIKQAMGSHHFLTRGINNVKTEMSLHVLAYNLKRVLNAVSMEKLLAAVA